MKTSDKYGIVALIGMFGCFVTAGAETLTACLALGIPSMAVMMFGAIKHYQHNEIGD